MEKRKVKTEDVSSSKKIEYDKDILKKKKDSKVKKAAEKIDYNIDK